MEEKIEENERKIKKKEPKHFTTQQKKKKIICLQLIICLSGSLCIKTI